MTKGGGMHCINTIYVFIERYLQIKIKMKIMDVVKLF